MNNLADDAQVREHIRWATGRKLFTPLLHSSEEHAPVPMGLSDASDAQVSDLFAIWTSESHRLLELSAALSGRRAHLSLEVKRARSKAAVAVRNQQSKLSAAAVEDAVNLDEHVIEVENRMADLEVMSGYASKQLAAAELYLTLLSREITQRSSLRAARIM